AEALNRLGLRMLFLFRNFLWQDMHQPESHDSNDWRDDQHDPGDAISDCVQRLAVEKRGLRPAWQCQAGERDQPSEAPTVTALHLHPGSDMYIFRFTLHGCFSAV